VSFTALSCSSGTKTGDGELNESVAGRWRRWGWRWLGTVWECASGAQLANCKACFAWALELRTGIRLHKFPSRQLLSLVGTSHMEHSIARACCEEIEAPLEWKHTNHSNFVWH
jgi:hypothetical protein